MIVFPNCKINLGLRILRKRTDNYHDLETLFYPVGIRDALEIIPLGQQDHSDAFPFTMSGAEIAGQPASNLCVRAYNLLRRDFPSLPQIRMHLHKTIPPGAGLGGGSSDAAFALILLNKMFGLDLSPEILRVYAAELGSDCPFFIINKPCYATGRGEILEPVPLDLSAYKFLVVNPGIHIDTGFAFSQIKTAQPGRSIAEIITGLPIADWKSELVNDFEKTIFPLYPEIGQIKDHCYNLGAVYASMSGSGSTVYGIFPADKELQPAFPGHYFVKEVMGSFEP